MTNLELVDLTPNAKILDSLRHVGYSNYEAICDIIDNSIDAGASIVNIDITDNDIVIADNGSGMDKATLIEALKLGSESDKGSEDLGRFGMGLTTGAISIAKSLEIYTKQDKFYYGVLDLDFCAENNAFGGYVDNSFKEESIMTELIKYQIHDSGTIIRLSKVDRRTNNSNEQFKNILIKECGRIFRKFIDAGLYIIINGKTVKSYDPLMIGVEGQVTHGPKNYKLNIGNGNINLTISLLPRYDKGTNKKLGINSTSQGFYIIRNNREIASGETLKVFARHPQYNRIRIELNFSAELDNVLGVNFSKTGVKFNEDILEVLKKNLGPQITYLRNVSESQRKAEDPDQQVDYKTAEELIRQKSNMLILPDVPIEQREKKKQEHKERKEKESNNTRQPRTNKKLGKPMAEFRTASMGENDDLYDWIIEGHLIVITWNIDHPFYDLLINYKEDPDLINYISSLVFSLCMGEKKLQNENNIDLFCDLRDYMSKNLRTLCK